MARPCPRESSVGKGYGLGTDFSGSKGIVLAIDCLLQPAVKGGRGISILGTVGKGTEESARLGLNLLRGYCPGIADSDLEIQLGSVDDGHSIPVSGESAGQAVLLTMISAAIREPFDAQVCATGTVDINGRAGLVGGVQPEKSAAKLDAARVNGFRICLIPRQAMDELEANFPDYLKMNEESGCQIVGCRHWFDYARHAFPNIRDIATLIERLSKIYLRK